MRTIEEVLETVKEKPDTHSIVVSVIREDGVHEMHYSDMESRDIAFHALCLNRDLADEIYSG